MGLSQRSRRVVERLKSRRPREREGLVLVEGIRAVGSALDAGATAKFIVVAQRLEDSPAGKALRERLEVDASRVIEVGKEELATLSDTDTPQGILLVATEPEHELGAVRRGGRYLVLDGVQDPGNAGTLIRGAVAFGLDGVLALDGTVDLWSPKCVRASAGLAFTLPVVRCSASRVLERFDEVGADLFVAEAGGRDVDTMEEVGPFALVVGNEGAGVRPAIRAAARETIGIPMPGPAESLNVGVAASILLYSLSRKNARG